MDCNQKLPSKPDNVYTRLRTREMKGDVVARKFKRDFHATTETINRLGLENELEGHTGCVNCLQWSEDGRLLASGSDDLHVNIWDYSRNKPLQRIKTIHSSNIFSVKFIPGTSSHRLVTGAADSKVTLIDTETQQTLHSYSHKARVKRIDVTQSSRPLVFSGSEDGTVIQYDLRMKESETLIDLQTCRGPYTEVKCVSVNPLRPELLAVGANDPFVRMYDRRYLVPMSPQGATYFVPGHLQSRFREGESKLRFISATYVTFSPNGRELLVNLGGDQVYLYDINKQEQPVIFDKLKYSSRRENGVKSHEENGRNGLNGVSNAHKTELPPHIELMKKHANSLFEDENYLAAVELYNKAVDLLPTADVLYSNRAAAYIKRNWNGDMYAALKDCITAVSLNTHLCKAYYRMCKCFLELKRYHEAESAAEYFRQRFPDQATSSHFIKLTKEIQSKLSTPIGINIRDEYGEKFEETSHDQRSELEVTYQYNARDYTQRFCGHCNTTTDIKEANFIGSNGQFICAGSDDGSFFIWDRRTSNIVKVLHGDDNIVNCIQPHSDVCMLATSGIESTIKIWTPQSSEFENEREVMDHTCAATANQRRMNTDPFEQMLMGMGLQFVQSAAGNSDSEDDSRMPCQQF